MRKRFPDGGTRPSSAMRFRTRTFDLGEVRKRGASSKSAPIESANRVTPSARSSTRQHGQQGFLR